MAIIDLNIGLVTSEDSGKLAIDIDDVISHLGKHGIRVLDYRIQQSDSEPTAVITASVPNEVAIYDLAYRIEQLCVALKQDAIAGRLHFGPAKAGFLLGPKAEEWGGKFIEEYYLAP